MDVKSFFWLNYQCLSHQEMVTVEVCLKPLLHSGQETAILAFLLFGIAFMFEFESTKFDSCIKFEESSKNEICSTQTFLKTDKIVWNSKFKICKDQNPPVKSKYFPSISKTFDLLCSLVTIVWYRLTSLNQLLMPFKVVRRSFI